MIDPLWPPRVPMHFPKNILVTMERPAYLESATEWSLHPVFRLHQWFHSWVHINIPLWPPRFPIHFPNLIWSTPYDPLGSPCTSQKIFWSQWKGRLTSSQQLSGPSTPSFVFINGFIVGFCKKRIGGKLRKAKRKVGKKDTHKWSQIFSKEKTNKRTQMKSRSQRKGHDD